MGLQVLQEKGELGEQVAAARMERNALLAAQRAGQGQGLPTTPSVANRAQPLEPVQRLEQCGSRAHVRCRGARGLGRRGCCPLFAARRAVRALPHDILAVVVSVERGSRADKGLDGVVCRALQEELQRLQAQIGQLRAALGM